MAFLEIGKLVSLAVEAGKVSHLASAHHGSLRSLHPGFCFAEVQQRQEDEWVLVSRPGGLGYPARPRNCKFSQVHTPGIAGRQKTCSRLHKKSVMEQASCS